MALNCTVCGGTGFTYGYRCSQCSNRTTERARAWGDLIAPLGDLLRAATRAAEAYAVYASTGPAVASAELASAERGRVACEAQIIEYAATVAQQRERLAELERALAAAELREADAEAAAAAAHGIVEQQRERLAELERALAAAHGPGVDG